LWEFLYGNNVLFRDSQVSEDGEDLYFVSLSQMDWNRKEEIRGTGRSLLLKSF